jgi:hypothetical protein
MLNVAFVKFEYVQQKMRSGMCCARIVSQQRVPLLLQGAETGLHSKLKNASAWMWAQQHK